MMYCIKYEKLTDTVHTYTCTNNQTSSTEENLREKSGEIPQKFQRKFQRN